MMELVVTACLMGAPERCEDVVVDRSTATFPSCLTEAPQILVEWAAAEPALRLRGWRCRAPRLAREAGR